MTISYKEVFFVVLSTLLMSVPAAFEPHHFAAVLFAGAFCTSLSMSIFVAFATKRLPALRRCLFFLFFLFFAFETYLFVCFGSRFDPNILTLILQTNRSEASEFISVYLFNLRSLSLLLLFAITFWGLTRIKIRGAIRLRHPLVAKTVLTVVVVLGFSLPFLPLPVPLGLNTLMQTCHNFAFVHHQHGEIDHIERMLDSIQITHSPLESDAPVIVLVIGESHNKHHSAIYGYALPTSPCAIREHEKGNLLVFDNAQTPTNGTNYAMRYFFSLKACDSQVSDSSQYVLMPAVFRKAGYKVAYFDNQYTRSTGGSLDYSCGYYLNPSRINAACFDYRNDKTKDYDGDFIQFYKDKMLLSPKALNIIHLKGQHFDAAQRYPSRQARFSSTHIKRTDLDERQRAVVAAYDNATLYNDLVLSDIIDIFRFKDAIVIYLSDHGEQIYDGPHHHYGRTFGSVDDEETLTNVYEVPFLVWCSDAYMKRHAPTFEQLKASVDRPVCTADIAYLLFDLADIDFNYNSPGKSFISPAYVSHKVQMQ